MNVMIFSAQLNDAIRDIGGSIAKWASDGANITYVYGCAEPAADPEQLTELANLKRALKILGANPEQLHSLTVSLQAECHTWLQQLIKEQAPDRMVWPPSQARSVGEAQLSQMLAMTLYPQALAPQILRVGGEQWFVDISDHLLDKQDALTAIDGDHYLFPHPYAIESIESSAQALGSKVNLLAAEAFTIEQVLER